MLQVFLRFKFEASSILEVHVTSTVIHFYTIVLGISTKDLTYL